MDDKEKQALANAELEKKLAEKKAEEAAAATEEAHKLLLERIEKKKGELDEVVTKIEKRNAEFALMAEEMKLEGRATKGKEVSDEEKAKAAAMTLIAGTGLEKRIKL